MLTTTVIPWSKFWLKVICTIKNSFDVSNHVFYSTCYSFEINESLIELCRIFLGYIKNLCLPLRSWFNFVYKSSSECEIYATDRNKEINILIWHPQRCKIYNWEKIWREMLKAFKIGGNFRNIFRRQKSLEENNGNVRCSIYIECSLRWNSL